MGSTVEDRYLIISLRDSKGSGATCLCKMFFEKRQNIIGLKTLIKKLITSALLVDCHVSGVWDGPTCTSVADCRLLDKPVDWSQSYVHI